MQLTVLATQRVSSAGASEQPDGQVVASSLAAEALGNLAGDPPANCAGIAAVPGELSSPEVWGDDDVAANGLQQLRLCDERDFTDRAALAALDPLFVGGVVWEDDMAVSGLADMSGLQQLQLCDAPNFADEGLLAPAALSNLTTLRPTTALPGELDEDEENEGSGLSAQVSLQVDDGA
jgi:hypothetical protein